jgi:tetratricopeptide (TPR) repeat protein
MATEPQSAGMDGGALDALAQIVDTVPDWAFVVAVAAAVAGALIGIAISQRRGPAFDDADDEAEVRQIEQDANPALPAPENPAFTAYQEFLDGKGIGARELDSRMRDFATQFKDMRQNLRDLSPGEPSLAAQVEEIRDLLDAGELQATAGLLTEMGRSENRDGLAKRQLSTKHLMAAAVSRMIAGDLTMARLEYTEAAALYAQAIESLPSTEEDMHAEYLNKHGTACYHAGEHTAAIASFERSLEILQAKLGKNHPDVAAGLNNLALLHYSRRNYDAAEPLYKRALSIDEQTLGIDHAGVATDLNNFALLYKRQGNLEGAEPLLKRALGIKQKNFDPGHPSLVTGLKNYASLLRALGRDDDAEVFEAQAEMLPPARTAAAE